MIVYPAYIYMTEKIEPTNPVIWSGGTVNYPYKTTNADFISNRFNIRAQGYVDFTLPLKGYTKVSFQVSGSGAFTIGVATAPETTKTYTLESGPIPTLVYDIPTGYRKNGVVIRIKNNTNQYIDYAYSGKME